MKIMGSESQEAGRFKRGIKLRLTLKEFWPNSFISD
jgi:hypothetical protein